MGGVRTGILGGSFDPPHNGHLALARHAATALALEKVILVPAAEAPLKGRALYAPPDARIEMTRAAAASAASTAAASPLALEVCDWEVCQGGVSYSYYTVRHLCESLPAAELFWIAGADQLARLPEWHRIAELAQLVTFAVAPRPGCPPAVRPAALDAAVRVAVLPEFFMDISSTQIRAEAHEHWCRCAAAAPNTPPPVFAGKNLPEAVRRIIERRRLYT
jgi:nicotinate-nucleotide adenylyltransferase